MVLITIAREEKILLSVEAQPLLEDCETNTIDERNNMKTDLKEKENVRIQTRLTKVLKNVSKPVLVPLKLITCSSDSNNLHVNDYIHVV